MKCKDPNQTEAVRISEITMKKARQALLVLDKSHWDCSDIS